MYYTYSSALYIKKKFSQFVKDISTSQTPMLILSYYPYCQSPGLKINNFLCLPVAPLNQNRFDKFVRIVFIKLSNIINAGTYT